MRCWRSGGLGMVRSVLVLLAILFYTSYAQPTSLQLQAQLFNLSLMLQPASAEDAAKRCIKDSALSGPGVLAPATLLLYVLQDVLAKNAAMLQSHIRQDPFDYNTGGSSLWVMDPWGSCRAIILPSRLSNYTGAVELSLVPCSWSLQYMCMEYAVAQSLSAGLTLPHNMYRVPTPPALPVGVPAAAGGGADGIAPPGYRLVRSGVKLGYATLPTAATFFSGRLMYQQLGPVVNIVGRWRPTGLDAVRPVAANDATSVVEAAMADDGTLTDYFGSGAGVAAAAAMASIGGAWAATPLPRENAASSSGLLHTSYVIRVEGCSSNTAVQRLVIVSAGGAAAAQGVTRCISNFAEEVAPGGFLAYLEGYYVDYTNATSSVVDASIVQLWFVWAVPEQYVTDVGAGGGGAAGPSPAMVYASGGVLAVAPRRSPPIPLPQCDGARTMIPLESVIRNRAECGQSSLEQFACPSYMCCGTTRGRVGICGTGASACLLSACDPRYGLCGSLPNDALEVTPHEGILGVAPAPSPLSSAPPYTTDLSGPTSATATATVRYGSSVYVLDKSAMVSYSAAVDACKSQTLYGLSWRLIMLPDAFAYEVTLLGRSAFLAQLSNRVAWVQPRPDDSSMGWPGCLTVTWSVDAGSVQLVTVQAAECSSIASVICKATWPVPAKNASAYSTVRLGSQSWSPPPSPAAVPTRWRPGVHSLSASLIGIGQPNSGVSCVFESFGWLPAAEVVNALGQVSPSQLMSPSAFAAPVPLGLNVTLDAPLAGIATRPLVTWSAVSSEPAAAYEAIGSIAVQYWMPGDAAPAPPVVLGSLDGTYLSENASYGAVAPAGAVDGGVAGAVGVAAYLSQPAGWNALQLDVANGEVVVEVSGCRGALVEQLLLRTSTGRTWTVPIGPSLTCSVPFNRRPPAGGYLVALQVFGGSYIEELKLVWGTPPANGVSELASTSSVRSSTPAVRPAVFGVSVGFAVLVPVLVAGIVAAWWLRRYRRRQQTRGVTATADPALPKLANGAAGGDAVRSSGCCGLELFAILVEGGRRDAASGGVQLAGGAAPVAAAGAAGVLHVDSVSGLHGSPDGRVGGGASSGCAAAAGTSELRSSSGDAGASINTTESLSDTCGGGSTAAAVAAPAVVGTVAVEAAGTHDPGVSSLAPAGRAEGNAGGCPDLAACSGTAPGAPSWSLLSDAQEYNTVDGTVSGTRTATVPSDGGASCDAAVTAAGCAKGMVGTGSTCSGSDKKMQPAAEAVTAATPEAAWTTPGGYPLWAGGPPPAPPTGSEPWAQSVHAALFYKVLYQWKPPTMGAPLVALDQAVGPGGGCSRAPAPQGPPKTYAAQAADSAALAAAGSGAVAAAATAARAAVDVAASPGCTSVTRSSVAAPWTSSANGSAASGGTQRSGGLPLTAAAPRSPPLPPRPPLHLLPVLASHVQPGGQGASGSGSASGSPQLMSPQAPAPVPPGGGTGCGASVSLAASAVDRLWPAAALVAAPAVSAEERRLASGTGGEDAAPRARSDQAATAGMPLTAAAVAAMASAAAAPTAAAAQGPKPSPFSSAPDDTELILGRDVLVDVDDPVSYLGHGTSGVVRRGLLRQPDGSLRPVAVKLLNQPSDAAADAYRRHQKTLLQEITILGSLRHPNIVQLLGGSVSLQPGASFLVEELCGRSLSAAIYDDATPYSLRQVLRWCCDIAGGLAYLHPNIMHRDLKPSNVLLDQYGIAKISDFGLARFKIHTTLVTRDAEVGTTCYMSPECFVSNDFKVTAACDVYSLGVMINEMVTRQPPWTGVRTAVVGFKVAVVGDRPRLAEEGSPLCPPPLRQLIRDCWAQHPEERPTSAEVLRRLQELLAQVEAGWETRATAAAAPATVPDVDRGDGEERQQAGPGPGPGAGTGPAAGGAAAAEGGHAAVSGGQEEAPGGGGMGLRAAVPEEDDAGGAGGGGDRDRGRAQTAAEPEGEG